MRVCVKCFQALPDSDFDHRIDDQGRKRGYLKNCRNCPVRSPLVSRSDSEHDRFWKRVERSGECWMWIGANTGKDGYGLITIDGKPTLAHRYSYTLHKGTIPEGLEVCHDCPGGDNRMCVNPDHLFVGTHTENMRDMAKKGRSGVRRGFDNPNTKLSDEDLRTIAERRNNGEPPRFIAADFGIRREVVYLIATGKYRRKF